MVVLVAEGKVLYTQLMLVQPAQLIEVVAEGEAKLLGEARVVPVVQVSYS